MKVGIFIYVTTIRASCPHISIDGHCAHVFPHMVLSVHEWDCGDSCLLTATCTHYPEIAIFQRCDSSRETYPRKVSHITRLLVAILKGHKVPTKSA